MPESAPIAPIEPDARILVINVARIGDTLLAAPVLRAIKHACPTGHLTCMAHPKRYQVLEDLPFVDSVLPLTKHLAQIRGWLPGKSWDYAVVYGNDIALVRYALRVSRRVVAFEQKIPGIDNRLFKCVPKDRHPRHAVEERLLLTAALGIPPAGRNLSYAATAAELADANKWLAGRGILPERQLLVGLQPSSFHTKKYRNWPVESFVELGRKILSVKPEAYLLLLGGPDDRAITKRIQKHFPNRSIDIAGHFSLREAAAIMHYLALYVGVDTGPTHLAAALRLPMVVMYHCYHRSKNLRPLDNPNPVFIVEHPRPDASCTRETPMSEITLEQVWGSVWEALQHLKAPEAAKEHAHPAY